LKTTFVNSCAKVNYFYFPIHFMSVLYIFYIFFFKNVWLFTTYLFTFNKYFYTDYYYNLKFLSFFWKKKIKKRSKKNKIARRKLKKIRYKNKVRLGAIFFFIEKRSKNSFRKFLKKKLKKQKQFYKNWNNYNYLNFYTGFNLNFIVKKLLRRKVKLFFFRKFKFSKKKNLYPRVKVIKLYRFLKSSNKNIINCYLLNVIIAQFIFTSSNYNAITILKNIVYSNSKFDFVGFNNIYKIFLYKTAAYILYFKRYFQFFFYKRFLVIYRQRWFFKKFKILKKGLKLFNSKLMRFYLLNFFSLKFYKNLVVRYNMLDIAHLKTNHSHLHLLRNKQIVSAVYTRLRENEIPGYFHFLNYFLKNFFENFLQCKTQFNFFFFWTIIR